MVGESEYDILKNPSRCWSYGIHRRGVMARSNLIQMPVPNEFVVEDRVESF